MQQLFMLENGTIFVWQGEAFRLLSCDEYCAAKVRNLQTDREENFNGYAWVEVSKTQ